MDQVKRARQLLEEWQFPHLVVGGVTLVRRADWNMCVQRIFSEGCAFHGYEMFELSTNGGIRPDMDWSASWSPRTLPTEDEIFSQLSEAPRELGHVEFSFSKNH